MFTLADFAVYVAIIASLGRVRHRGRNDQLNINFLTKPEPRDMIADVRLIRLGRRLAVGEAELASEGVGGHRRPRHRHLRAAVAESR